jgi:hypothetical protein
MNPASTYEDKHDAESQRPHHAFLLRDIKIGDINVSTLPWKEINKGIRIYYRLCGDSNGYEFIVLQSITHINLSIESAFDIVNDDPEVDILFFGLSLFDGLRHLYMGKEEAGYLCYPNPKEMQLIFKAFEELDLQYCNAEHLNYYL